MNIVNAIKIIGLIGLILILFNTAGCNSMGKIEHSDGRVEKVPQDVGVARAVAVGIGNCKDIPTASFTPTLANDCTLATGVTDRAECFRSNSDIANTNAFREMSNNNKTPPISCAQAATNFGKSYMEKEAVQAKELGSGTKFAVGAAAAYGATKELVSGFVAGSAAGDTTVGTVNVNGSSGSGTGGEGSGTGGASTVNANIGAGNAINTLDGASQINTAEKQLLAPNSNDPILSDDDGNGNTTGLLN